VPETRRHLGLRTALFQILEAAFADRAVIGSEQFVYWDPTDPKACCAPDVMVRVGEPDAPFDSWKVWERGAPQLAIEVISASDADYAPWERKLERYRHVGVRELVRFDPDDAEEPLRIWDLLDGDAVERDRAEPGFLTCQTLGAYFCLRQDDKLGVMLRLARDGAGKDLFPTPHEARRAAEARIRELEAELARRG
jgi:Uma2 family endonuclease